MNNNSSYKYAISIIVPIFNGEDVIRQTLTSLQSQTLSDIQIICVNDGSVDGTAVILAEMSASDSRIRVVSTENGGVYKARETGIRVAEGEYAGFCDCGDTVEPTMFEELYRCAQRNTADMVVCGYQRVRDGVVIAEEMQQGDERSVEVDADSGWLAAVNTSLWNKLIRAEVLQHRIRLDNAPRVMEDAMLLFSIYPSVKHIAFLPKALYRYNTVAGSAMSKVEPEELDFLFEDWLAVRACAAQQVAGFERIIDVAAFVHMGVSASLRLLQNEGRAAKRSIDCISKRLTSDFPTLVRSPFLNPAYVKANPSMKSIKLAYACWRARVLIPALRVYSKLLKKSNKGISW